VAQSFKGRARKGFSDALAPCSFLEQPTLADQPDFFFDEDLVDLAWLFFFVVG
jgi:hypothetical protein